MPAFERLPGHLSVAFLRFFLCAVAFLSCVAQCYDGSYDQGEQEALQDLAKKYAKGNNDTDLT